MEHDIIPAPGVGSDGQLATPGGVGVMADYSAPPIRIQLDLRRPFPRGTNAAHRHLRNQESAAGAASKRSLLNKVALAFGAPEPPKLTAADQRSTHRQQAFPYDYVDWGSMTPDAVSEVMAGFRDRGVSPATRNAIRAAIRGVATEAWMLGQMGHATLDRIKQLKAARHSKVTRAGTAHSAETIRALLDLCDGDASARACRDGMMIALMASVGLRRAEVVSLQLKDIDLATGDITVEGKGQKQRTLTLPDCVLARVTDYLDRFRGRAPGYLINPIWPKQTKPSDDYLPKPLSLRSVNERLEHLRRRLPEEMKLAPHDLRRTCATDLREAGMTMREIQVILGHASVVTTERYILDDTKDHRDKAARLQSGRFALRG